MDQKPQFHVLQNSLKAYAVSLLLFFVLIAVLGALLCFGPLPEKGMMYYTLAALVVSCLVVGLFAGAIMKKKGLIYGACYSAILLLIVLPLLFFMMGGGNPIGLLRVRYLFCLLAGAVGGILGVNLKN